MLDENEPFSTSDRAGNYALSGLSAGTYTIRTELPAGWSVASGITGQNVTLAAGAISSNNNFDLIATNTSVTGGLRFVTLPCPDHRSPTNISLLFRGHRHSHRIDHYDLSLAPEGMSIDPATGLVAWRPSIAQVGEQLVVLRATVHRARSPCRTLPSP